MSRGEMRAGSRLEHVLRSGRFAVTAELNPPDTADPHEVYDRALLLASVCDAINATDASGAHVHMSSVGVCSLLLGELLDRDALVLRHVAHDKQNTVDSVGYVHIRVLSAVRRSSCIWAGSRTRTSVF